MMRRILFVNHVGEGSGAETDLLCMLRALRTQDYLCVVACPPRGRFANEARRLGIEVIPLATQPLVRTLNLVQLLAFVWSSLLTTITLFRAVHKRRIDIVHANSFTTGLYAMVATRLTRRPLVWHMHDILTIRRFNRFFVQLLGCGSAAIVCVSRAVKCNLMALGADERKCVVVYNALYESYSIPDIQPAKVRHHLGVPQHAALIGLIGQLAEWKGQHVFLEAAKIVLASFEDACFLIVGDVIDENLTGYKDLLHRSVSHLGLDGHVIFAGYRTDVPEIMGTLDILVHSSIRPDPFPTVLLEGLAAGRCIVAARVGGVPEIIQDKSNGLLVEPSDADELASALLTLLKDDTLRRRLASSAAETHRLFNPRANLGRLTGLYDQLLIRATGEDLDR